MVKKTKMLAFHSDPKIKEKYLARVAAHEKADEIIHGIYWDYGKGCAVGCTIHSGHHADYESTLGIPEALAHLEDNLFEAMINEQAKTWPRRFLEAIPVGADLSLVIPRFLHWLLVDEKEGVIRFVKNEECAKVVRNVGILYGRLLTGDEPSKKEFSEAIEAVRAAWAAWAAGAARAAQAVRAAGAALAAWAAGATEAAWAAWAAGAARAAQAVRAAEAAGAAERQAEKLLQLLMGAPVTDDKT